MRNRLRRSGAHAGCLLVLASVGGAAKALEPIQVTDSTAAVAYGEGLDATPMLAVGEVVFFRGRDVLHGWELWRTAGTPETTRLVRDICPGPCDSQPDALAELAGRVYFFADDGLSGRELWTTDGTAAGTMLIRDACPGACGAGWFHPALVRAGERLYFAAWDFTAGRELWSSDGTLEGTSRVLDLCPGLCDSGIFDLTAAGSDVVFRANDAVHGLEPWRSGGTVTGTTLLGDLCAGSCSSGFNVPQPGMLLVMGGEVFTWRLLSNDRIGNCWDLWTTDPAIRAGKQVRVCGPPQSLAPPLVELSGDAYFGFEKKFYRLALPAFEAQEVYAFGDTPSGLMRLGAYLYFVSRLADTGRELWRTDGTSAGTTLVHDAEPGYYWSDPGDFTAVGDRLFFTTRMTSAGDKLWVFETKTGLTRRLLPTPGPSSFRRLTSLAALGDDLLLAVDRAATGKELWRSDGTATGTELVKDLYTDPGSSDPKGLLPVGDSLLFGASTVSAPPYSFRKYRVLRTDASAITPAPFLDLSGYPYAAQATPFSGSVFFGVSAQLVRTVGIPEGSEVLENVFVGDMEPMGDRLFLSLNDVDVFGPSYVGGELWVSNGTLASSRLVADIFPGRIPNDGPDFDLPPFMQSSNPSDLTPTGAGIVFSAEDADYGRELWQSDGATPRTTLLADICPGLCSGAPAELTSFAGRVFLSAADGELGRELWVTDGTAAGTRLLKDLSPGPLGSAPVDLAVFADRLVFFADDGSGRERLWSSDGTAAGTVALAVTTVPGLPRAKHEPTVVGQRLFFNAWSVANGQELWVSDGTATGTRQVADILPGPASAYPHAFAAIDGLLLFAADDGAHGVELWASDGTPAGTVRLTDLARGSSSSDPSEIRVLGGRIFFAAGSEESGRELWALERADLADLGCHTEGALLCLNDGRFAITVAWRDQHNGGRQGVGHALAGEGGSGFFWFFTPDNLELAVKVLDGHEVNGNFWVLFGALSDVEYWVTVADRVSGESRVYHNPPGTFCGQADVRAFPVFGGTTAGPSLAAGPEPRPPAPAAAASCVPAPNALCLQGGRFQLSARWRNPRTGEQGSAQALPQTADTGAFWFFDQSNVELLVKVLDGRTLGGKFWLFFGALSDVEYWVTTTDTFTGVEQTHHNPAGTYCGRAITDAF